MFVDVDAATQRLIARIEGWSDDEVRAPSALPAWTRGHVLTHLARNADALAQLLVGIRAGEPLPMYSSRPLRDADIDAGATRPGALVVEDAVHAAHVLGVVVRDMPDDAWDRPIVGEHRFAGKPATFAVLLRLREVEIHHVDLGAGYGFADCPAGFVDGILDELPTRFADALTGAALAPVDRDRRWVIGTAPDQESTSTISGTAADIVGWAAGRTGSAGLTCDTGPVPASPGWG